MFPVSRFFEGLEILLGLEAAGTTPPILDVHDPLGALAMQGNCPQYLQPKSLRDLDIKM